MEVEAQLPSKVLTYLESRVDGRRCLDLVSIDARRPVADAMAPPRRSPPKPLSWVSVVERPFAKDPLRTPLRNRTGPDRL